MTTKQNDAAAMTQEQLVAVVGGYAVHDLAGKAGMAFSADGANDSIGAGGVKLQS